MNAPIPLTAHRPALLAAALARLPLLAPLRGLTPADAEDAAGALYEAGWRLLAVAADDPQAGALLARLRAVLPADALAGCCGPVTAARWTVLAEAGAAFALLPHLDAGLIRAVRASGALCIAGAMTPTEAIQALQAGAEAVALFPAALISPAAFAAIRGLLPPSVPVLLQGASPVGALSAYAAAGAAGLVADQGLYEPGLPPELLAQRARSLATAWEFAVDPWRVDE